MEDKNFLPVSVRQWKEPILRFGMGDEDGGTPLPPDGGGKDPNRLRSQFVISGFEKNPCHQVSA